jgi:4-hydroxy-tetrahydrodipicolinate reductase
MAIRVVMSGTGKMGREIMRAVALDDAFDVVGALEGLGPETTIPHPLTGAELRQSSDPEALFADLNPDVVIDFTNAAWTPKVAFAAVNAGARPVIGTSALPPEFVEQLRARCEERNTGAFIGPNFAIGAVLMMHFARLAAPYFDSAEVIELHHDQKVDAPSGTAVATARDMVAARGRPFAANVPEREAVPGARGATVDGVSLHAVRLPGLVAHQEVLFGGLGQLLTIRHDSLSRDSFMPGIVLAAKKVMELDRLVVGLERLLGLA